MRSVRRPTTGKPVLSPDLPITRATLSTPKREWLQSGLSTPTPEPTRPWPTTAIRETRRGQVGCAPHPNWQLGAARSYCSAHVCAGAYKHPSSVGRQADSRKKKEAEYSFPVAPKERKRAVWQDDESPANYHHERACGRQTDSTKESLPSWTFANTARGDVKFKSQKKPGPGQYRPASAIGRQANSTKKTAPSCSFGGREKFGSPYGRFPNAWT